MMNLQKRLRTERMGSIRTKLWWYFAAMCLVTTVAQAQIDNNDTIYSRFGIGHLYGFSSSQAEAMGGAASGIVTVNYLNLDNPATWADQIYTRFSAGFRYTAVETRDAADNVSELNNGLLSVLDIGFPIYNRKLGMVVTLQPYSRVGYMTSSVGNLPASLGEPETQYLSILEGDGGLQMVRSGLGYRPNRYISIGASADFIFGMIDYSRLTVMEETGSYLEEVGTTTSTRMHGVTSTLGMTLSIPDLNDKGGRLSLGGSITLPASLNSKQVTRLVQESRDDTLGGILTGDTELPLRARLGVSYRPSGRFLFALEGRFEDWSAFSSEVPLAGASSTGQITLNDSRRIGGGLEWSPSGGIFHPNFFRRSLYRLGAYAEQAYYMPGNDLVIRTFAATAGISMPSLFPGTYVDLNTEVGTRGATSDGLVRDLYVTVSATINFGERWFVKRRFR